MNNHDENEISDAFNFDSNIWDNLVGDADHAYDLQCTGTEGQNLYSTADELLAQLNQDEMMDHFDAAAQEAHMAYTLDDLNALLNGAFKGMDGTELVQMPMASPDNAPGKYVFVDETVRFVDAARRSSTGGLQQFTCAQAQRPTTRQVPVNYVMPMKTIRRHSLPASCSSIFFCPWTGCGKSFNRTFNLKSHYRTHTQEKPFTCPYCQIHFARNHDLKRHMLSHMEEKPYVCPGCSRAFSRSDALGRHRNSGSCGKRRA